MPEALTLKSADRAWPQATESRATAADGVRIISTRMPDLSMVALKPLRVGVKDFLDISRSMVCCRDT